MKIKIFILSTLILLSACSSPPKPTAFPTGKLEGINHLNNDVNIFSKNRFDNDSWRYLMSINGSNLANDNHHSSFWYLAQHADHIMLVGEENNIKIIKHKLIKNNSTNNINIVPTCDSTNSNKCSDLVNLYFYKFSNTEVVKL